MRHNQNRRARGRTNNRKGPNPLTRSYESNGPDVKVRGTAMHVAEKYMSLARDAVSSGDNVAAENYLQHAEHYSRIVAAAQAQLRIDQPQQFRDDEADDEMAGRGRDRFGYYNDPDLDENGEERFDSAGGEEEAERPAPRQQQPQQQGRQEFRGYQAREGQQNRSDGQNRNDGYSRNDGSNRNDGQNRSDGQNRPDGQDRYNGDQPRRDNRGYQARPDSQTRNDNQNRGDNQNRNDYRSDSRNDNRNDSRGSGQSNNGGANRYNVDRPRGDYRDSRGEETGERLSGGTQQNESRPARTETTPEPYTADAAAAQEREFEAASASEMPASNPGSLEAQPGGEAVFTPEAAQEEVAPRPRRRRAPRAAKADSSDEASESGITPDGEAALAAFPD